VALRLAGDYHGIKAQELLDQSPVLTAQWVTVRSLGHLGPEHRVVLGERVVALHMELGVAVSRCAVEEDGFLERRDKRVPDPAEHRVVGPDREVVLATLGEPPRVVQQVALRIVRVNAERACDGGVHSPAARFHVFDRDERQGIRMVAVLVDEPDRMKDLHRVVGIQAGEDLRDHAQVAVDELAEAAGVVDRRPSRAPADEQLEVGDTERVLHVDGE
jgi:hypothetical protein